MLSFLFISALLASASFGKDIVLQNKGKNALKVSVSGHGTVNLAAKAVATVTVADDWSGTISGCSGACSGNVRSVAHLNLGTVDTYDVSIVKGFNLPLKVIPVGGKKCKAAVCGKNINTICPAGNRVLDSAGKVIACRHATNVFSKTCPVAVCNKGEEEIKSLSCSAISYRVLLG